MENAIVEIIKTIVPSLIVLAGTLLGVNITNKANEKRQKDENNVKEKYERIKNLREKMEELYLLHSRWFYQLHDFHWAHVEYFGGKYTHEELNENVLRNMEERRILNGKIDMLVNLYFPELSEKWNSIKKQNSSMLEYLKIQFIPKHLDRKLQDDYLAEIKKLEENNKEFISELSQVGKRNGLTTASTL